MAILTVGTIGQFAHIADAIAASHDGDVLQVQAGTYVNDFATINTKITIQGIGGMVHLQATVPPPSLKGIFVVNNDLTIDHLEFSGSAISAADGNNGAGIRYQGGNLTITNCYFHDNQDGILATPLVAQTGNISISTSEFAHNGAGDGFSHNLYVNDVSSLTIDRSYFHDAVVGHEIKSRAENTTITNSRIQDGPTGTASYSIDLPNGGNAVISNDTIQQGPNSQNPAIIAYGEEGGVHANSTLAVSGNTILNDLNRSSVLALWNASGSPATFSGNSVYGLTAGQLILGSATVSGTSFLSTEPALDTSSPNLPALSTSGNPDWLFNASWYLATYPAVAAGGVDPFVQYMTVGWKAGQNPSAWFDTNYYLTHNPDVAAAGVNPLTHFETLGWQEGRNPSASFDTSDYLAANPDVKAAGVDPLIHWIYNGEFEGRPKFAVPATPQPPGVDAKYYYAQYPDVKASGTDAASHFFTQGFTEGRNPNAWFNTNYYLVTYKDIAAAHIDPLLHYENQGWLEGRDPSAAFSTTKYLAAYADARASGIDPMSFYLRVGQFEGETPIPV